MAKKNRSMKEKTQKKSCLFSPHRRPTTLGHGCENEVRKPNPEGTIPIFAGDNADAIVKRYSAMAHENGTISHEPPGTIGPFAFRPLVGVIKA